MEAQPDPRQQEIAKQAEVVVANAELDNQKAAVAWLRSHKEVIMGDTNFAAIWPMFDTLNLLDEELDLDYSTDPNVLAPFLRLACLQSGLDPKSNEIRAIGKLSEAMMEVLGKADPRCQWWMTLAEQSAEDHEDKLAGLAGAGGEWKVTIEPDSATESGGVKETQKAVVQLLMEIAKNQSKWADKELPFMSEPPDASTTVQTNRKKAGENFLRDAANGNLPWQKESISGNNEYLGYIVGSKSSDVLVYNALHKFADGYPKYFEWGEDISQMPVRIYRELENGKSVEYIDVPAEKFVCADVTKLEAMFRGETLNPFENTKWTRLALADKPDLENDAPVIGISIGGSPRPDSALFRHSRTGQSVVNIHHNLKKNKMDLIFGHMPLDGAAGLEWAFAVAETLGAREKDSETGLDIEWYPPTFPAKEHSSTELAYLRQLVEFGVDKGDYLDNPHYREFLRSFELSDISISNEISKEAFLDIKSAADALNAKFYGPVKAQLLEMFKNDLGPNALTEAQKKIILNRLGATQMTVTKFIDVMGRNFFGPAAVCMMPRDPEVRLLTAGVPKLPEHLQELVRSFGFRNDKSGSGKVFDDRELARNWLERRPKVGKQDLIDIWKKTFDNTTLTYVLSYLQNMTDLTAIQRSITSFRKISEMTALVLSKDLLESLMVEVQTSHFKNSTKADRKSKDAVLTRIVKFVSAQTTPKEKRFSHAYSTIGKNRGHETLRYNDRIRLEPRTMKGLRMSNSGIMSLMIESVVEGISQNNEDFAEKCRLARVALEKCVLARSEYLGKKDTVSDYFVDNNLIVISAVTNAAEGTERKELIEGLKILTIVGLVDQQNRFISTCSQAAKETVSALA